MPGNPVAKMKVPRLRRLVRFLLVDQVKEVGGILLGKKGQGTLRAHMVWGTVGTFSLKILNTAFAFGTSVLLARLLGAKEYGVYAYAISWASLLSVPAVMGLNTLLVREVARYKTLEDWGSLRGILRWSDRVVLVTSTGLAALFALIVWALRGKFDPEVRMALWITMALVPLLSFLLLRQGGLQGLGYVVEAQVPQFLILPGFFLVLVCGVYFTVSLSGTSAVGLRVVSGLIATLTALFFLRRHLPEPVTDVSPLYHQREWLKSALPLLFVGAAGIINQRISTVMVGSMLGAEAAGVFDVSMRGAALVSFILMAVNMPLAPAVAELYARGEKERLQRLITKSARVALFGSLPIALGMILFGRWVLLIFGKDFTSGSTALAILSVGQLVNVGMGSVGLLLNMTGHERDTAKGVGIAALANIILNVALIPLWNVNGAAAASAISLAMWNVLLAWQVYKKIGIFSTAFGCPLRRTT
jgi:O-antigen/teichoic acid export membrane protein